MTSCARSRGSRCGRPSPTRLLDEADEVEFVDLPARGPAAAPARGQGLRAGAGGAGRSAASSGGATSSRCASWPCGAPPSAWTPTCATTAGTTRSTRPGRWPSASSSASAQPRERRGSSAAARRMAARLRAEWLVVYVESPAQPPLTAASAGALAATSRSPSSSGRRRPSSAGDSVSEALLRFARERNVSKIVVGKPAARPLARPPEGLARRRDRARQRRHRRLRHLGRGSDEPSPVRPRPPACPRRQAVQYLWSGRSSSPARSRWALHGRFDRPNLIMVYLLGVAFVASRYGRGPSAATALLSVAAFDFFFVPPYLTFAVADTQYLLTFGVMLLVGAADQHARRARPGARPTRRRARARTPALYAMSRELAAARTAEEVARARPARRGRLRRRASHPRAGPGRRARAGEPRRPAHDARGSGGRPVGLRPRADRPGSAPTRCPGLGALRAARGTQPRPRRPGACDLPRRCLPLAPEQRRPAGGARAPGRLRLERARLADEAQQARVAAETERLRSTLLSSVSHDLRTPLAAITGAASALLQDGRARRRARASSRPPSRGGRPPEPPGRQPARHDAARVGHARARPRVDLRSRSWSASALARVEPHWRAARSRRVSPRTCRSWPSTLSWWSRPSSTCSRTRCSHGAERPSR